MKRIFAWILMMMFWVLINYPFITIKTVKENQLYVLIWYALSWFVVNSIITTQIDKWIKKVLEIED